MERREFIETSLKGLGACGLGLAILNPLIPNDCITSCVECKRDYECCTKVVIRVSEEEKRRLISFAKKKRLKTPRFEVIRGKLHMRATPCVFFNYEAKPGYQCEIYPEGNEKDQRAKECIEHYCSDRCRDSIPERYR